jgi:hypothetical protein
MLRHIIAAALVALALPALAGPARAQSDAPVTAVLSALALQPMPEATSIDVVTYDDSDLARSIGAVARQALAARGYQVGPGGQLRLGLELRDELQIGDRTPTLGSARVERGEFDDSNVRVNIFADNQDSVLGGRVGPTTSDALRFGLYVTLNDMTTGRRIWQAEIMADISGSDRETAGPQMVQAALQRLGEPVSREQVILE